MSLFKRSAASAVLSVLVFATTSAAFAAPFEFIIGLKERTPVAALAENAMRFGISYTPEEIRKAAAPTDDEYREILGNLKQQGFTIVKETKSHLFVTVRSDPSTVENAFQTRLSTENGIRRLLSRATLPGYLDSVSTVVGLDTSNERRPHFQIARDETNAGDADPGRSPKILRQTGVLPAKIKTAYGFDPIYHDGITGKGQAIAIATYHGFRMDDVTTYFSKIGVTSNRTIDIVEFNGTARYEPKAAAETELDIELAGMIAPGADIHVFASSENSEVGELAMFTAILDDNRAKVVNYSWGSCERRLQFPHKMAMDVVFAQAVAQGVNIFVASGDLGSDGCGNHTLSTDFPSANPYVVSVGGTTLIARKTAFEKAWSGSGGGISMFYGKPAYQAGLGQPYVRRSVPDVAFNADPATGEAVWQMDTDPKLPFHAPRWFVVGGTSMAAPQWAGYLALVGEGRARANLPTVGFLNPILYGLSPADRDAMFTDTIFGNNGQYVAATGYDAVTGLGSMKAAALYAKLIAPRSIVP